MSIFLVRHAHAGNRAAWRGEDRLRPLTEKGLKQAVGLAEQLTPLLLPAHPQRLLTSPHVRCVQTLEPLAATLGVPIEEADELTEGQPSEAKSLLRVLLDTHRGGVVLCTHGDIIAALLSLLSSNDQLELGPSPQCEKGSVWRVDVERGRPTSAQYLPPTIEG